MPTQTLATLRFFFFLFLFLFLFLFCFVLFCFFFFERTKHQPRRNLRGYLVLQRLCNEAALAPALVHFAGAPNENSWQISAPQVTYSWLARETEQIQNPSWQTENKTIL